MNADRRAAVLGQLELFRALAEDNKREQQLGALTAYAYPQSLGEWLGAAVQLAGSVSYQAHWALRPLAAQDDHERRIAEQGRSVTREIDITPATDPANLQRLADALEELHAAIRVPNEPAIPLPADPRLLARAEILNLPPTSAPLLIRRRRRCSNCRRVWRVNGWQHCQRNARAAVGVCEDHDLLLNAQESPADARQAAKKFSFRDEILKR